MGGQAEPQSFGCFNSHTSKITTAKGMFTSKHLRPGLYLKVANQEATILRMSITLQHIHVRTICEMDLFDKGNTNQCVDRLDQPGKFDPSYVQAKTPSSLSENRTSHKELGQIIPR